LTGAILPSGTTIRRTAKRWRTMERRRLGRTVLAVGLAAICALAACAQTPSKEDEDAKVMQLGRHFAEQFSLKKLEPLHEEFSAGFKETMNLPELQATWAQVALQLGSETELLDERVVDDPEYRIYVRRSRFSKFPGVIEARWLLNDDREIAGLFFTPERKAPASP
jgi:hypothetical protein